MSDIIYFLTRDKVVLEIIETTKVTPEIIERISSLVKEGFRFALDDVIAESDDVKQLLPLVEIVKFDLADLSLSSRLKLSAEFKRANKKILA